MYWLKKYLLLHHCRRPVQGSSDLNDFLNRLIYFGPLFYIAGVYLWTNILRHIPIGTIPNGIALGIAVFIAVFAFLPVK